METILPQLGYAGEERALTPEELRRSDAAMIVGTLDEISTVISIDGNAFRGRASATAPVAEVARLYRSLCCDERTNGIVQLVPGGPRA